ncbi:hypothetical protein SCLCIDRAFT_1210226 [Scleroderma citrinum Foug A]|uniref:Uncharacterized protein n=1 Tax=Scleroderma citrinum Foug A TaxID=1036808 RepID=A0A0C3EI26_9AGAM|nr:hypothetical protein SCLCIDRAFT_1210226 [Scleroderma citrinum Foug A]
MTHVRRPGCAISYYGIDLALSPHIGNSASSVKKYDLRLIIPPLVISGPVAARHTQTFQLPVRRAFRACSLFWFWPGFHFKCRAPR